MICPVAALDAFDAGFRPFLYRTRVDGDEPVQATLDGSHEDAELSRRLPQLEPLKWNEKFPGFRLVIVKGMGLQNPIVLPKRELSDFVFEAQDGGTVKITFRASGTYENTAISGELDGLQQKDVEITLEPPAPDQVAQPELGGMEGAQGSVVADARGVLVSSIKTFDSGTTHMFSADVSFAGGNGVLLSELWAYRPTLDEIAAAIFDELDESVEFTPAARSEYESAEATA